MLYKTQEFQQNFNSNLQWITINKNVPLKIKGSYTVKKENEIITDIDIQANVKFNDILLKILYTIIQKNQNPNSPFKFIQLGVGRYDGFKLPWIIDNIGQCHFNIIEAKKWFDEFKNNNLVPSDIINQIQNILYSDQLLIRNLIEIEDILLPYSEIIWTKEHIKQGFLIHNNKKYYLLDAFQTETPVLEFVYKTIQNGKPEYVNIDLALSDFKYNFQINDEMYRYYTQDWYKIFKSLRWKIPDTYKIQYFNDANDINVIISLKYQIELLQNLFDFNVLPEKEMIIFGKNLIEQIKKNKIVDFVEHYDSNEILSIIDEKINNYMENIVFKYVKTVEKPKDQNKLYLGLDRAIKSQIPLSQQKLLELATNDIKCPFFKTDTNYYLILSHISAKLLYIPIPSLINCLVSTSFKYKKSLDEIINNFIPKNDLYIEEYKNNQIVLKNNNKVIGYFTKNDVKKLQLYIFVAK